MSAPLKSAPPLAAEILGGQLVGIRIEENTLMFYDPATRVLLRTRPNPAHPRPGSQAARRPPRRATTPPTVRAGPGAAPRLRHRRHRGLRAEDTLGRVHAGQTLTVAVSDTTLAIELDDAETRGEQPHHHHASP